MNRRALIIGMSGQDGQLLAGLLSGKGYDVHGTSRSEHTKASDIVQWHCLEPTDARALDALIAQVTPHEIYHLAGQTSVGQSFAEPAATFISHADATLVLLECLRITKSTARVFLASSSECFGETDEPANEDAPLRPWSPYGAAKAAALTLGRVYRRSYDMDVRIGILFNHESPLRLPQFVTRRIAAAVSRIAAGSGETLELGNIDVRRDWGWAEDYVECMWRIVQTDTPDDFVVATGQATTLRTLVALMFESAGLDWQDHVRLNPARMRREPDAVLADPSKARDRLGWTAKCHYAEVARRLLEAEQT